MLKMKIAGTYVVMTAVILVIGLSYIGKHPELFI